MNADVSKFVTKSKQWQEEFVRLRAIGLEAKLEENLAMLSVEPTAPDYYWNSV